jgi:hypothetical protein
LIFYNRAFFFPKIQSQCDSHPRKIEEAGWRTRVINLLSWSGPSNADNCNELSIFSFGEQRHQSADESLNVRRILNTSNHVVEVPNQMNFIHPCTEFWNRWETKPVTPKVLEPIKFWQWS